MDIELSGHGNMPGSAVFIPASIKSRLDEHFGDKPIEQIAAVHVFIRRGLDRHGSGREISFMRHRASALPSDHLRYSLWIMSSLHDRLELASVMLGISANELACILIIDGLKARVRKE